MGLVQRISGALAPLGYRSSGGPDTMGSALAIRWYGMREAGEELRGRVVTALNAQFPEGQQGGRYPDPRGGSVWSWRSMIQYAAYHVIGIDLRPASPQSVLEAQYRLPPLLNGDRRCAWIHIDPPPRQQAVIEYRQFEYDRLREEDDPPPDHPYFQEYFQRSFQIAMVFAYLYEHRGEILDPDALAGYFVGDTDAHATACYHQFAIAFLGDPLAQDCPEEWECQCKWLRIRYNYAPPEHSQPTDSFERQRIKQSFQQKIIPMPNTGVSRGPTRSNLTMPPGRGTVWTNPNLGDTPPGPNPGRRTGA